MVSGGTSIKYMVNTNMFKLIIDFLKSFYMLFHFECSDECVEKEQKRRMKNMKEGRDYNDDGKGT